MIDFPYSQEENLSKISDRIYDIEDNIDDMRASERNRIL